jgi:hypothetical protein
MKILFAMSSPEYLRFYDDTIRELAARGHEVALAATVVRQGKPVRFESIAGAPGIRIAGLVPPRGDRWVTLAAAVRGTMDFVRYLHPDLAGASALRARVKRQGLPSGLQWVDRIHVLGQGGVARVQRALERIERAIPIAPPLVEYLERESPDVLLVSPLVEPASEQVDLVRAAQSLGIRVAALIASWDNLTNKGDLRVRTGLVAVWNDAQKREAMEYHRVPADAIAVTGAQPFDRWFARTPSKTREAFCRDVGLPDDRPFVLFTGSSIFIARAEVEMPFVRSWIQALRASRDPRVRDLAILVRPHPYNGRAWNPDVCADLPGVAVWPRGGYDPVEESSRAGLFDSLFFSEAVVGVNTSAMIEAAIVGRPVFSIEAAQFAGSQGDTLHYRHLLPENGGFLRVASTLDAHAAQLSAVLGDPASARTELARFVGAFVRPHGLDRPATPLLADAIARFGSAPAPAPVRSSASALALRPWLALLRSATPLLLSPSELRRHVGGRAAAKPSQPKPIERGRVSPAVAAAALIPATVASLLLVAFVFLDAAGRTPFTYTPPRNAAEAAGMGNGPEVLRFIRQGDDPAAIVQIRPDIISSSITHVTPAEAAVWSRRGRVIALVDRLGGIPDDAARTHLACLAAAIGTEDVGAYLARTEAAAGCDREQLVREIEARSR